MALLVPPFSPFEVATINGAPTGLPSASTIARLEEFMARERMIGVWTFPHFVRYLRAIALKLTPAPHHCVQAVLDAADAILAERCPPRSLAHLWSTPPDNYRDKRYGARITGNAIAIVVSYWAGFEGLQKKVRVRDERTAYERALTAAKEVEALVLEKRYLTPDDLYECGVAASVTEPVDDNVRDAAVAAMSAGHFQLAHEIATDAPREKS